MSGLVRVAGLGTAPRRLIPTGRLARAILTLTSGAALSQALVFAASPLITRLYSPSDLGVFGAFVAIVGILAAVAALRYPIAIPIAPNEGLALHLLALSVVLTAVTSAATAVAVWLVGGDLVRWTDTPGLARYLWLLPFTVFGAGVYLSLTAWAIRYGAYRRLATTRVEQNLGMVVVQVGLGALGAGAPGLLLGGAIGQTLGSDLLVWRLWREQGQRITTLTFRGIVRVARMYRRFPQYSATAMLLGMLCTEVPVLLLGPFYGAAVVGWYVLAQRVLSRPLEIVAGAANHVYLGSGSAALRDRPDQLPALFRTLVGALFVIATPYVVTLALLAPTVFPRLFGPDWAEAALYVRILAPMVLLRIVATTVQDTLEVFQRQDLYLARELIRITVLGAIALVIARFVPNPAHGLALLSATGCVNYLVSIAMSAYAMKTFITHHTVAAARAAEEPCYG